MYEGIQLKAIYYFSNQVKKDHASDDEEREETFSDRSYLLYPYRILESGEVETLIFHCGCQKFTSGKYNLNFFAVRRSVDESFLGEFDECAKRYGWGIDINAKMFDELYEDLK